MAVDLSEKRRRRKNERNAAMYDQDVFDLLQAIDSWRRKNDRSFPAWSEVLQILKALGWRKVAPPETKSEATAPVATAPVLPVQPVEPSASSEPVEPMGPAPNEATPRAKRS